MGARTMTLAEANRIAQKRIAELEAKVERLEKALETLADATNSIMLEPLHKIAKQALEGKQDAHD